MHQIARNNSRLESARQREAIASDILKNRKRYKLATRETDDPVLIAWLAENGLESREDLRKANIVS